MAKDPVKPSPAVTPLADALCYRFETEWVKGRRPRLEDYLAQAEPSARETLLVRLLTVELRYRRDQSEEPSLDEYLERFADCRSLIEDAFVAVTTDFTAEPVDTTPNLPPPLSIRCPHCLSQIAVPAQGRSAEVECPACGTRSLLTAGLTPDAPMPSGQEKPKPRTVGHFQLLRRLGAGGFGEVWKARDLKLDRIAAVKLPHRSLEDAEEREKFLREARAAAQLRHPHIVSVHEVGQAEELVYIVSEYIDGVSLDSWLAGQRPTHHDAALLGAKIADALHYAHEQGIVHRDLKPSNILIDRDGEPHLMDFGLAKRDVGEVTMTMEGQILGTPAYMSPEQAKGQAHTADRRSDVYSLGVILFELLTGERPFRGDLRMLLRQVVEDEAPSPRKFDSHVARDLETICLKCLQKDPGRRYPTAQALSEELGRFLGGVPILARPVGRLERSVRWCRRNPLPVTAIVGLLFGVAALAGAYVRVSLALQETRQAQMRVRQTVDKWFTQVSEDTLLKEHGMQPLRRDLLLQARDYYDQFLAEGQNDPALRDELALAHFRVGRIAEEVDSPGKGLASYRKAHRLQTELLIADPDSPNRLKALGDTLNAVGISLAKQRDFSAAREAYEEAIEVRQRLTELLPEDRESRRTLANAYMNLGLVEKEQGSLQASRHLQQAQEIRERLLAEGDDRKTRLDYAMGCYGLANLFMRTGQIDASVPHWEIACQAFERVLQSDANDLEVAYQLAMSQRLLGDVKCEQGKRKRAKGDMAAGLSSYQEGFGFYRRAKEILEPLAEKNPAVPKYRLLLAEVYLNMVLAEGELHHREAAIQAAEQAHKLLRPLANTLADDALFGRDYRMLLRVLTRIHPDPKQRSAAQQTLEEWERRLAKDARPAVSDRSPSLKGPSPVDSSSPAPGNAGK